MLLPIDYWTAGQDRQFTVFSAGVHSMYRKHVHTSRKANFALGIGLTNSQSSKFACQLKL